MSSNNYWQLRQAVERYKAQIQSEDELNKRLKRLYSEAADDVIRDMERLYDKLLLEGEDTLVNNYYSYNRYYKLREQINKKLNKLGEKSLKTLSKEMEDMYKITASKVLNDSHFELDNDIDNVVKALWSNQNNWSEKVWCKDGLSSKQRMRKSMQKLQQTLERGMTDCVARGASKDELIKTLMKRFDVSYSDAARLARTELTYIQNQATKDSFIKAGVGRYKYLAAIDDRTSDICRELDGQIFSLQVAEPGLNYPPMHSNCRSTVLAVLD